MGAKQTLYLLDANLGALPQYHTSKPSDRTLQQISLPSKQVLTAGYTDKATNNTSKNGSLFSRTIISGLRGFADKGSGDSKNDGIITATELADYVRYHLSTKRKQLSPPRLLNLTPGAGDFFFMSKSAKYIASRSIPKAAPAPTPRRRPVPAMMIRPSSPGASEQTTAAQQAATFPWPPPKASSTILLSSDFLSDDSTTLLKASREISDALSRAGQDERRYYSVPGGFAIVTRLELISKNGDRIMQVKDDEIDFLQYIKGLFWKQTLAGNFRMIAFIVTDQSFNTNGDTLTKDEANELLQQGYNKLPASYDNINFTDNHDITALIYEFSKPEKAEAATLINPGTLRAKQHMNKTGWYCATRRPFKTVRHPLKNTETCE